MGLEGLIETMRAAIPRRRSASLEAMSAALRNYQKSYFAWAEERGRGTNPDWWAGLTPLERAQASATWALAKKLRRRILAAEKEMAC